MDKTSGNPFDHYTRRVEECSQQISTLARYFRFTGPARLLTFTGLIISGLWFIKSRFDETFLWLSAGFLILFVMAVIWDIRLVRKQKMVRARLKVNEDELKYLNHQYHAFDDGSDLAKANPERSGDFDLFGMGSLFQYLNRCITGPGRTLLGQQLVNGYRQPETIRQKQESIEELAKYPDFIEDFRSIGLLANMESDEIAKLKEWLDRPAANTTFIKWAGSIWPFLMVAWIVITALGILSPNLLLVPIMVALFLVFRKNKTIQKAHSLLGRSAKTLKKYAALVTLIENHQFSSAPLQSLQQQLSGNGKPASHILKNLFNILERFDYRLNLIAGTLLNILFLFDFHILTSLENWKRAHLNEVPEWFNVIARLDAMTGFAVFAYNNGDKTVFPEVLNNAFVYEAGNLKHPLLPDSECIGNDISFSGRPKALIITGANMAGKSTFLRTLAVNLILGMNGAPVCAQHFRFTPCDIRSSINIRDSLVKHESYFYAELSRLQRIVKHVEQNPQTLIVLDEILRGTNSRDKHNGSMGLIEKLIKLNAVVIVATHDLGIGNLEEKYPGIAANHCFEVELEGNQLIFDYKLKPGISQKLNASFLMQKMGLTFD